MPVLARFNLERSRVATSDTVFVESATMEYDAVMADVAPCTLGDGGGGGASVRNLGRASPTSDLLWERLGSAGLVVLGRTEDEVDISPKLVMLLVRMTDAMSVAKSKLRDVQCV